ncbi:MAG TPA: VOC family protein [Candidatus Saccharimonadia bacterium]|nr:VOC family protein [Candidatus Saccharimonadia bacterium]
MVKRAGQLKYILIDAEDSEAVAQFWSRALGRPVGKRYGPFIELEAPAGAVGVTIQRVPKRTSGKNNIHFDLQTDDLDASEAYIVEMGGRLVEVQRQGRWEWRIMADPEGNVFCLVMS